MNSAPKCIWCDTEMVLKTIFGKNVYECPNCKRRIPVENAPGQEADNENATAQQE